MSVVNRLPLIQISDKLHRNLVFWGMAFIAIGLPLSVFMVSVGMFVLAGNWLLERNFKQRLKRFFTNPLSLITISIYLLFVVGMVHTQNIDQGLKELRIKLPILLLPLFLFTSKLPNPKRLQDILMLFVLACVIGTGAGMIHYLGISGDEVLNRRHLSVFISHIRFGLMIVFSIFILAYHLFAKRKCWSLTEKILSLIVIAWLFYFLVLLESPSSYLGFVAILGFSLWRMVFIARKTWLKIATVFIIIFGLVSSFVYVNNIYQNHILDLPFNKQALDLHTVNGRKYRHKTYALDRENGHRVWNFVCWEEVSKEWSKISLLSFEGKNKKGNWLKYTVVRYITSKGLRKDSVGIHALTPSDVQHIENGITNYKYADRWGVSRRIDQLFWEINEYEINGDPNTSSLIQRLVYFRSGWKIAKNNLLTGVGTGDVRDAFNAHYIDNEKRLVDKRKGISHNQYMSITIGLGIFGLLWFLFAFFFPLCEYWKDPLYGGFILLIAVSLLSDNTLDLQAGATLFAFFNALLIVRREFLLTT